MAQPKKTLYQILGIARDANPVDVGLAYEMRTSELQRAVPPDPSGVALIQQAYEILSNPQRRAAYDAALVTAAEKAAAAEQAQAPDLEVDAEDAEDADKKRKLRLMAMVGGMAVVLILLFLAFRPKAPPPPPPEPVAEAPKPAPPPKLRTGTEILADAATSSGQLLSYSMSGAATPIGMAVEVDQGQVVTTCHGIPAGAKIVLKVAGQALPADLNITDEELDLCRLTVEGFTTPPLKVAAEDAKAGDKIFAVGMNAKGELAATEGTVSKVRATPAGKVLELSVPIAAGASGGGIFNDRGQLVGIATTPHTFGAGLNVALPVSWIAQMRSRSALPPK